MWLNKTWTLPADKNKSCLAKYSSIYNHLHLTLLDTVCSVLAMNFVWWSTIVVICCFFEWEAKWRIWMLLYHARNFLALLEELIQKGPHHSSHCSCCSLLPAAEHSHVCRCRFGCGWTSAMTPTSRPAAWGWGTVPCWSLGCLERWQRTCSFYLQIVSS